jgi:endoglucanase
LTGGNLLKQQLPLLCLAQWHFRGGFGILDSERPDVRYEDFKGHKLDAKMLEVIRES